MKHSKRIIIAFVSCVTAVLLIMSLSGCVSNSPQLTDAASAARDFSREHGYDVEYELDASWSAENDGSDFRLELGEDSGLTAYTSHAGDKRYFSRLYDSGGITIEGSIIMRGDQPVSSYIDVHRDPVVYYAKFGDTIDSMINAINNIYEDAASVGKTSPDPKDPSYMSPEEQQRYNDAIIDDQLEQEYMDDFED